MQASATRLDRPPRYLFPWSLVRRLPQPAGPWRSCAGALLLVLLLSAAAGSAVPRVAAQVSALPSASAASSASRVGRSAAAQARLPLAPLRPLTFTVDEGTLMSVDVSPDGTRLAFDIVGQIFTLPITGGRAYQVTAGPAFAAQPLFTRDGRGLLFGSDRGGTRALWRIPVDGGVPQPVRPTDTAGIPARRLHPPALAEGYQVPPPDTLWAPDHRYGVRFPGIDSTRPMRCLEESFEIVEPATGHSRRVPRRPGECVTDWGDWVTPRPGSAFTPDGAAFITSFGGKLHRVELATGRVTRIPFTARVTLQIRPLVRFPHRLADDSLVHARHLESPRLAPNERQVAFIAFDRLWQAVLDGWRPHGRARRVTTWERLETDPVWSPDGQFIAFAAWSDSGGDSSRGDGALYRVRADGKSAPERLTRERGDYRYSQLTYTADGQRLVALRQTHRAGVTPSESGLDSLELVQVPAAGDAVTAALVTPLLSDLCRSERGSPKPWRGLAPLPGRPAAVQLITDHRVHAVALTPTAGSAAADTMAAPLLDLRDRVDRGADSLSADNVLAASGRCPLLVPTGDRALVYQYHTYSDADLYLVDLTPQRAGASGTAARGPRQPAPRSVPLPRVRRIALPFVVPGSGPEAASWAPDGRSFTYAYGRTLYRYDLARADSLLRDSVARAGTRRAVRGPAYRPSAIVLDAALPRARPPQGTLVFRHARLITMQGDRVIERGDLVVRDGRIAALGLSGTVAIPRGAQVIEAAGRTILPGLVDLHNHLTHHSREERTFHHHPYEAALAFGVLTSRDPQAVALDFLTVEDDQAAGLLRGPRVRNTGPGIGEPFHPALASLADARVALEAYTEVFHVEYLKEYELSRRDQREWLVMAAAERGLNVVSHGHGVAHLIQNAIDGYGGFDHRMYTRPLYADVRQLLARTGITLAHHDLGTFGGWNLPVEYFRTRLDSLHDTTALRLLAHWMAPRAWALRAETSAQPALWAEHWRADSGTVQLARAGARIAVASHGDEPGYATHMYLWALVKGGMPPLEALRSGTMRGAEALGLDRDLGSLAVGKRANLLVLNGNPLERIEQTMNLDAVLFEGRLYDPVTLNERWPQVVR